MHPIVKVVNLMNIALSVKTVITYKKIFLIRVQYVVFVLNIVLNAKIRVNALNVF